MQADTHEKVWDPFVRFFHWTVVAAFAVAYLTEDEWLSAHVVAGYIVGALIVARFFWGFIGSRHARFADFVRPLPVVGRYLSDLGRGRARRYLGHNPAGGAMIVLMLVSLALLTVSGLAVYAADQQAGPLAAFLGGVGHDWEEVFEEVHEVIANFTLFLVFVHVGGVLVESLMHRENLVRAMFTGVKNTRAGDVSDDSTGHPAV